MAPAGLADDLTVVVHQQPAARLAEVAAQQAAELPKAVLIAVVAGQQAMELLEGHAFAGHLLGAHKSAGRRRIEHVGLGPEAVGLIAWEDLTTRCTSRGAMKFIALLIFIRAGDLERYPP